MKLRLEHKKETIFVVYGDNIDNLNKIGPAKYFIPALSNYDNVNFINIGNSTDGIKVKNYTKEFVKYTKIM